MGQAGGPVQAKGGVPCRLRVTTPGVVVAGTAQMQQRRGAGGGHPAPHCDVAASASYSLLGLLSKPAHCGRLENKVEEREGRSVSFWCFSCQASPLLYYY